MPRRQTHIEGGKLNLKKIGKDIDKGFKKTISKPIENKIIKPASKQVFNPLMEGFQDAGIELGQFTNEQLLPAVVSTGIPLASTALGVLGAEFGIPPELTSTLSQNLMEEYIPKQYQSKNKYVNLFADALNMGVGGADPYSMMKFQQNLTGALGSDLGKQMKTPIPTRDAYNPDNPYQDLMLQLLMNYYPMDTQPVKTTSQPPQPQVDTNPNDDFDARYGDSQLGEGADSILMTKPPYQQREGNVDALLGSGIKKKRGRLPDGSGRRQRQPKKVVVEEIEIYTKKKPSYKKFSHAKNSSLEQLLEAKADREEKEAKKAMKEMVEKQTRALTALGFGVVKGSKEAKEKMAKLRALKKKK